MLKSPETFTMTLISIFFIAIALSLDAVAVAAANGARHHNLTFQKTLQISFCFGFFQFFMPIVGWLVGSSFEQIISSFDHWVSFILLVALGIKMISESFKPAEDKKIDIKNLKILILLSIATSIDALIVGTTFAVLPVKIWPATIIIGLVTFIFSLISVYAGKKFGAWWGKKAEIAGGLILLIIGFKILISHLVG